VGRAGELAAAERGDACTYVAERTVDRIGGLDGEIARVSTRGGEFKAHVSGGQAETA